MVARGWRRASPSGGGGVVGDGAVGGLVLEVAVGAHQDAGHHGQGAGGGGDEVAHHVAVVVLAGPDHAPLGADDLGGHVVDEGVAVGEAGWANFSANSSS